MNRVAQVIRRFERRKDLKIPPEWKSLRKIDCLGWRFVLANLERDMFRCRVYQADEIDLMKRVLDDGLKGKYPSREATFVTFCILARYTAVYPLKHVVEFSAVENPSEATMLVVEESVVAERDDYMKLIIPYRM